MKYMYVRFLLLLGLLAVAGFGQAQTLSHYPVGVEGIKGATLPPPGLYIRDYNYIYFKDAAPAFGIVVNTQAPRLVAITKMKLFGGNVGMDILFPFTYQDLTLNNDLPANGSAKDFNLGDIFVEPLTLSWHATQFDVSLGWGMWVQSGNYHAPNPVFPAVYAGKGFTSHMYTAGATYYYDKEKTISFSALGRYESAYQKRSMWQTPGDYFTVEWGVGKKLFKYYDFGAAGYFQRKVTADQGAWPHAVEGSDRIVGFGPEVLMHCPYLNFDTSIRWAREAFAIGRPAGNMVNVTITKKFARASN
jgi:hypothetical protein